MTELEQLRQDQKRMDLAATIATVFIAVIVGLLFVNSFITGKW